MKIGILTFHRAVNCGAMLQAWALARVLRNAGHEVGFIQNKVGVWTRWEHIPQGVSFLGTCRMLPKIALRNIFSCGCRDLAIRRFDLFHETYLPEVDAEDCDLIVVGSDQVWRAGLTREETPLFRGIALPDNIRLVSYAASYGDGYLSDEEVRGLAYDVARFHALSVREPHVREQLQNLIRREVEVVVDPTMLLTSSDYDAIANRGCVPAKPYLFAYAVHATPFFVRIAREAASRLGIDLIMTSAVQSTRWNAPSGLSYGVSPDRMIGLLKGAQCVVASSFHGTALAALHGKPFVSLREDGFNLLSRPVSFLMKIGEERRIVSHRTAVEDVEKLLTEPVLNSATARLQELRAKSLSWLNASISYER